jgi:hypothetical protein
MKAGSRTLVTTLVLLAAAGGAVALAYFGVEKHDEAAAAQKEAGQKIFKFAASHAKTLTVEAKGETTHLTKVDKAAGDKPGDVWRVDAPLPGPAENATVVPILNRMAELQRKSSVVAKADPASLKKYGLEHPATRVTVTLDDGKTETLALGAENAFDSTIFVLSTGGAIDLVAGDAKYPFEKGTFDLREKRMLPFEEKDLSRIEVTAPKLSYTLFRAPDAWKLEAPIKDTADESAIDRVLGGIRGLLATSFVHDPKPDAAYGLDHPRWKVKMTSPSGESRTVVVGEVAATPVAPAPAPAKGAKKGAKAPKPPEESNAQPLLYARLEGSKEIATIGSFAMQPFAQDLFALRDKKVLHFDVSKVATARFTVGGTSFEAKAEGNGKLLNALHNLASLKATAIADETGKAQAAYGLDHPSYQVVLADAAGKELDTLRVAEHDGKTYAQGKESPRIVAVTGTDLTPLPHKPEDLKETTASAAASPANATAAK